MTAHCHGAAAGVDARDHERLWSRRPAAWSATVPAMSCDAASDAASDCARNGRLWSRRPAARPATANCDVRRRGRGCPRRAPGPASTSGSLCRLRRAPCAVRSGGAVWIVTAAGPSCGAAWVPAIGDGRLARPSCGAPWVPAIGTAAWPSCGAAWVPAIGDGRLAPTIARHVNASTAGGTFQASARSRPSTSLRPERCGTAASEPAPRSPSSRHRGWRGDGVRLDLDSITGC